ncbi:Copper transport protein ATX1 [Ananas comosus]|uniref:Copper transport protein ATX1 n=1 Tax=Ananas comosus TaxID=4615 RepID=A0A199VY73_ANACO|nr:Copper transport protein ATX1 [Ananas comosus]
MSETVVLKVAMSCQGCAGAVKRALSKMEVFETVSKTGKKTSFWEAEAENKEAAPASASASAPTPAPTATATTTATA